MQVFKFGGASVKDATSVKNVFSIIKKFSAGTPTLMVLSAMGKTTNLLEGLADAYYRKDNREVLRIFEEFVREHEKIREELGTGQYVKKEKNSGWEHFVEGFRRELGSPPGGSYDFHYDQIVSKGELASTLIVSEFLHSRDFSHVLMDARNMIITDDHWREAGVDFILSGQKVRAYCLPVLKEKGFILTQGFIGATKENYTTTLGREGSDYSAALFSYFLEAEKMIVWKDVPGILNADPRYFKNPQLLPELSYYDAIEMTYYGASVIHPKTIRPLQNKKIPLYVRSFMEPEKQGTVIAEDFLRQRTPVYIYKPHQILISVQPFDFRFVTEDALSVFFRIAHHFRIKIHLMHNSALNFSICTDFREERISGFIEELQKHFRVQYNSGVGLLTVRNYQHRISEQWIENKKILLELRTRNTLQWVLGE